MPIHLLPGLVASLAGVAVAGVVLSRASISLRAGVARQTSIEGPLGAFRGLMALAIFIHHQDFVRTWAVTGKWEGSSRFLVFLGHGPVLVFLMISGYVFWRKAIRAEGRISAFQMWASRFRRLAPAYYFSLAFVLVQSMTPLLSASLPVSLEFLARTLSVGFLDWSQVPGLDTISLNGHVQWILFYQWRFYLAMPLLGWFCMGRRFLPFFIVASAMAVLAQRVFGASVCWLAFLPGILAAKVQVSEPVRRFLADWRGGALAAGWVALVLALGGGKWIQIELLAVVPLFWVVVSGNTLFGLLSWGPLRITGKISYSFYLLHAIVLLGVARFARHALSEGRFSPLAWAGLILISVIGTSLLSAGCWHWVEEPFRKSSAS